ncbi:MAG: FAD-dependent oxidoreductase [Alphaproteobacteria bacterium]|nr:FAD-dependent oxidoreductase [Alphaproteobacteria bacterium]
MIVGAGPAGTRAAETLVRAGLRPVVIDEAPTSGGQIYRRQPKGFTRPPEALYGFESGKARKVHAAFDALSGKVDYRPDTLVWEIRQGKVHTIAGGSNARAELPYGALILATGAMDRVSPFPGWTLPGVYTLGGSQIALKYQGCGIGSRVVFAGSSPLLYLVAYQYAKAGATVAAVIDTAPFAAKLRALPDLVKGGATFTKGLYYTAWLRLHGVPVHAGATLLRAEGGDGIARVAWRGADGAERSTDCDALGFGFGLKSETQLADLVGVPFVFDEGQRQFVPQADAAGRTPVKGVYVCGDGAGIRGADAAELAGERAALALLADRGQPHDQARAASIDASLARLARFRRGLERAFPFPEAMARAIADDTVVCRCEAVTAGEARKWMRELGACELNRVKAFSRVGMGRCQGRVCGTPVAEIVAQECGLSLEEAGRLRGQPPIKPIPLDPGPEE